MKSFIPVPYVWLLVALVLSTVQALTETHTVEIRSTGLFPERLQVQKGDTVWWVNNTPFLFRIVGPKGSWTTVNVQPNSSESLFLNQIGNYEYYAEFGAFDWYRGAIRVVASNPIPANDYWSGAITLTNGAFDSAYTGKATSTGDPASICDRPVGKGLWYSYTTPEARRVVIITCGSNFDTVIGIYTAAGIAQVPPVSVACNDDNGIECLKNQASVSFDAEAGVIYRIFIAGANGQSGDLMYYVGSLPPRPINDTCAGAISLVSGVTNTMSIKPATSQEGFEPPCQSGWTHGVWYKFTPTISGQVAISTLGSNFDTLLSVYSGACDSLSLVPDGCNNDDGPVASGQQASVVFTATAGTTYYILAAGSNGSVGNLRIVAEENYGAPVPSLVQILETRVDGNGQFNLLFSAPTGSFVEASTNLVNWTPIAHTFDAEGRYTVQDTATNHTQRFYRIRRTE